MAKKRGGAYLTCFRTRLRPRHWIARLTRTTQGVLVKAWLKNARPLLFASAATFLLAACDEQLDGGLACPTLCPGPSVVVRDTTLSAIDLDTSIAGYPPLGSEPRMFITSMGDTLQTRGIIRYDTLPLTFRHNNTVIDSNIVEVDTGAHVRLYLVNTDTVGDPVTIELYDVDMNDAEDADPSVLAGAFTPARLIGSRTFPADSLRDSLNVPVDPNVLLAKIQAPAPGNRLRVGIRVTSASSPKLSVLTSNGNGPARLNFRPSPDSTVPLVSLFPRSKTPDEQFTALDRADFLLVTLSPPDPPADVFRVGGLPARRTYLRFDVPANILDSTTLVRATLLLTQRANGHAPEPTDSVAVAPLDVTASSTVQDLTRALLFIRRVVGTTDSLRLIADGSGLREIEMTGIVRSWRFTSPDITPRAMALVSSQEAFRGRLVDFFSTEALAAGVRPRLRITYLPRPAEGIP